MAASPGDNFLLQYKATTPEAQPGGDFLLGYPRPEGGRSLRTGSVAAWALSAPAATPGRMPWGFSAKNDSRGRFPWSPAVRTTRGAIAPWGVALKNDKGARYPWKLLRSVRWDITFRWGTTAAADIVSRAPWGVYRPEQQNSRCPWGTSSPADNHVSAGWGLLQATRWHVIVHWAASRQVTAGSRHPFGRFVPVNIGTITPIDPGGPPVNEYGTILIPSRRTYIVMTETHLVLTDTGEEIPCAGMTAGIDHSSWLWSIDARISAAAAQQFEGAPVEITATWNGYPFRAITESLSTDRAFARRSATIRGRSPVAVLGDPYAARTSRENTVPRTAQQLAVDALDLTGVTLDWQITDWYVHAGVWSHLGTPAGAVQQIAGAVSALIQADPIEDQLHLLPYYPLAPWYWDAATPDVIVPLDAVITEGVAWRTRPDYNRAHVSGQNAGILGQVTRAGTAGDKPASLITDPLITHAAAARQRGIAVLGDTGRQAWITLGMPISDDIPLLLTGQLIELQEGGVPAWRGLVRGVRLSANMSGAAVSVRQHITLERHLETA